MSNRVVKEKAKSQKKERAEKKVKQKMIIIISVCFLALIAVVVLIISMNNINKNKITEIYGYHGQIVQLLDDGRFTALLAHNVRKNGTYTKSNEDDRIAVLFNTRGRIETGWIINNSLHIPREWDDGHGHGNVFPKIN